MKVDTALISAGIADVERLIEDGGMGDPNGIAASTLRIVVDCIGGVIRANHSRFNIGEFQIESMPISNERLKLAILASLGQDRS